MSENQIAPVTPGYKPPAVSIRATYTVGETTDELVVDIDRWDGDVAVITGVIDALTEAKPGSTVGVDTYAPSPLMYPPGVRGLHPVGSQTIGAPAGATVTVNAAEEGQR